jgi:tRNA isopentenyl-2-thiomethyl-A-37 hydroxylase MiaE
VKSLLWPPLVMHARLTHSQAAMALQIVSQCRFQPIVLAKHKAELLKAQANSLVLMNQYPAAKEAMSEACKVEREAGISLEDLSAFMEKQKEFEKLAADVREYAASLGKTNKDDVLKMLADNHI